MITRVDNKKTLRKFIFFVRDLYKTDKNFACPIFFSLKKELNSEVLTKKRSVAAVCLRDGKIVGRILFGVGDSKQRGEKIGYFSYFDCIEDYSVAKELVDYMLSSLKDKVAYVEGTFSPFDPDTRRGILVKGFTEPHTIFTSYNYSYYGEFLEKLGFSKAYDTFTVRVDMGTKSYDALSVLAARSAVGKDVSVDDLNLKDVDGEVEAVHRIFEEATFALNYQEAPSVSLIRSVFRSMKAFIDPSLVKIARERETGRPIGFCLVLKDYNEILRKTKGKIKPFTFLFMRNKIKGARGILQYVVPEYQGKGLICMLYKSLYDAMRKKGITYFEGGTIMEDNAASWKSMVRLGGEVSKVYRIYGKEI